MNKSFVIVVGLVALLGGCGGEPPEPSAQEKLAAKQLEILERQEAERELIKQSEETRLILTKNWNVIYPCVMDLQIEGELDSDEYLVFESLEDAQERCEIYGTVRMVDGFGNPLGINSGPGGFILVSAGPDGRQNTSDDIHYLESGEDFRGFGVGAFDSVVWSEAAPEPSDQS